MRRIATILAVLLSLGFGALMPPPALAVLPDEILDDPVLEARAREISKGLRCLVCQNENIDDSNAQLARDLRLLVRERLVAGDTDEQVVAYIVDRYGEFVLLKPRFSGSNLLLWAAGPLLLVLAGGVALIYLRRRQSERIPPLSEDEERRVAALLKD